MTKTWDALAARLEQLAGTYHAVKLLHWDQSVAMPPKGSDARARAIATMESMAHELLIDPAVGELLGELEGDDSLDDDQKAHVRALRRDYDKATKVPSELVAEMAREGALGYVAWMGARDASDWSMFEPNLVRLVDLKKQEADALGWEDERYDALLDQFEPDMTTKEVESMFEGLLTGLKPLADQVLGHPGEPPAFLTGDYDEAQQAAFCHWLADHLGFDTQRGQLVVSPTHPFTMGIGKGDVRQTTRTHPRSLFDSVYAVAHETGHALYEQGLPERLADLPAGRVASLGLHESQSRMWENQVCRSRPFTDWMLPFVKERFPIELGMVTPDEFHLGANYPQRTTIRITADELTYNFHIVLRFELEVGLFRGEIEVSELPERFSDALERHVGVRPDNDAQGVLQDVHWSTNLFGYFPTYTLGTLYSAAFFAKADEELGGLHDDLRRGDGSRLLAWLREKIHSQAYLRPPKEIGESVLGGPLGPEPLIEHLRSKYAAIYDL